MIIANLLNPNASLNSFKIINSVEYVPGAPLTLIMQLFDDVEQLRYIPPTTARVSAVFNNVDNTTLSVLGTAFAQDGSMLTFSLSAAQTTNLFGGNILIQVDMQGDGTNVQQGIVQNVLGTVALNS